MGFGSDPDRFYRTEYVSLDAGAETTLTYDAPPDQVSVRPAIGSIIVDFIEVRAMGAQGGAEQLRGTGPIVLPGISKKLWIKNHDATALTLIVTAHRGYSPLSVVMPTTLAAAGGTILDIPSDGWINDTNGWTYATATTVIAPGDVSTIYQRGRRVRWKQGGGYRYAYVLSSVFAAGQTTITLLGGSAYPVLVAAITDIWWSPVENPESFPWALSYLPDWHASGVAPAVGNGTIYGVFSVHHSIIEVWMGLTMGATSTFGTGDWYFGLPVAVYAGEGSAIQGIDVGGLPWWNGTASPYVDGSHFAVVNSGGAWLWGQAGTAPFAWVAGDILRGHITAFITPP